MVKHPRRRLTERGVGRTGCLLFLLVVVAGLYFGVPVGGMYIRYYRFLNEMETQARFAPSIDDGTIRRRLVQQVDLLGLPPDASRRLQIRRTNAPREIRISTSWSETIELPFYSTVITLRPSVRERM